MIGIICFWDRLATPYLKKYEELLKESNLSYEVVFWDRSPKENSEEISVQQNIVTINLPCSGSFRRRVLKFFEWKRIVRKVIKNRKYDKLIILSTVPAVLLSEVLVHRYNNKYLFDIRDYTFEKYALCRKIVMRLVEHSAITAISSKGYLQWLEPSEKIMVNHNITVADIEPYEAPDLQEHEPLKFAFVGNVRLDTQTRALLLSLKNDPSFEQHFYGRILNTCNIQSICEENKISNVYLHGSFDVDEKKQFFSDIDLINAVYANAEEEKDIPLGDSTPLPNRLYDCLVFHRPLVVSKGTYLAELTEEYHLGCTINGFDHEAPRKILEYARNFDKKEFSEGCEQLYQIVIQEEKEYIKAVQAILSKWR